MQPADHSQEREKVSRRSYMNDNELRRPALVHQVAVPPAALALSTLSHIDYEDAYFVDVGNPKARTAEQWVRAIFDDAPNSLRLRLWSGWVMLGLRLAAAGSAQHVLGWGIRRKTDDFVLLGAHSLIGMPAELLLRRQEDGLLFDTFVQKSNPLAKAVWAGIRPIHQLTVPIVLNQFRRRISQPAPCA